MTNVCKFRKIARNKGSRSKSLRTNLNINVKINNLEI